MIKEHKYIVILIDAKDYDKTISINRFVFKHQALRFMRGNMTDETHAKIGNDIYFKRKKRILNIITNKEFTA